MNEKLFYLKIHYTAECLSFCFLTAGSRRYDKFNPNIWLGKILREKETSYKLMIYSTLKKSHLF